MSNFLFGLRWTGACAIALAMGAADGFGGESLRGNYLEARTCQVYTGPCFANGEVGLTGKDAVMSWSFSQGILDGVDLSGLHVAVVVNASHTLGFQGLNDARSLKSIVFVDGTATDEQQRELVNFVQSQLAGADSRIVEVRRAPIAMKLDAATLTGSLRVGEHIALEARRARPNDCICSNESAYYPPLAELSGFVPGVTTEGDVHARALGTRWSIPDSRTAYLGRFQLKP